MNWYFEVLKKYTKFDGRARRAEYWYFILFNTIISYGLIFIEYIIFNEAKAGILLGLYTLAVLIPSLAVGVRRLHDTNRSGWWILISLIPIIGVIVLFVFMVIKGTDGENEYGADSLLEEDKYEKEPEYKNETNDSIISQSSKTISTNTKQNAQSECKLHFLTGEFEGNTIDLKENKPITIGRDSSKSNIIVQDNKISSAHLKINFNNGEVIVEDLNSTNGSFYFDGNQKVEIEKGSAISLTKESSGIEIILAEKEIFSFKIELVN